MRFWDSSALVPLLLSENLTETMQSVFRDDPDMIAWWATEIECLSALARREREHLPARSLAIALDRLAALVSAWHEVDPSEQVRRTARRLLRVHPLRAADALQLAAALVGAEAHAGSLELVSLDTRLADAARREGFTVVGVDPE